MASHFIVSAIQHFIRRRNAAYLAGAVVFFAQTANLSAQTMNLGFGKNRVQYHRQFDEWQYYETPNFTTYWYGDARNVAQSALQMAELDFYEVQQMLEHQMTDRIEMLVFSDLTDLKQSNIGNEDLFQLTAGQTKVIGNKVFTYFDGNHNHLRAQIREGMASVILNSMMFGANLQEIVQNAVLLNLPGWYTNGLAAYCGEEWSTETDNEFRDLLQQKKFKNFDKLAKEHPRLAGYAFWHYVGMHFGKSTISNLLYLTRINRSLDAGFLYVLGSGYKRTTEALLEYYRNRYADEAKWLKQPEKSGQVQLKNKKRLPYYQIKLSPDGKRLAWVSNESGRWRVIVRNLSDKKQKVVMKGGARNAQQTTDLNYPLLAWHPDNQQLAIMFERRDIVHLSLIDLRKNKKETKPLSPEYQRVYSMDFVNGVDLVLAAEMRGFSDLFIYHTINRQSERLTQDFWDDADVSVATIDGRKSLLFASNRLTDTLHNQRLDTILPIRPFDIFIYDLETRSNELIRVTNTPLADERLPVGVDSAHFAFISDENGIGNRQVGRLEPYTAYYETVFYLKDDLTVRSLNMRQQGEWPQALALAFLAPEDTVRKNLDSTKIDSIRIRPVFKKRAVNHNQTNYDRRIATHHVAARSGKLAEAIRRDRKYDIYIRTINPEQKSAARLTRYRELTLRNAGLPIPPPPDMEDAGSMPEKGTSLPDKLPGDSSQTIAPEWLFQLPERFEQSAPVAQPIAPAPKDKQDDKESENTLPTELIPPRTDLLQRSIVSFGKPDAIIRFNPSRIVPYRLKFRTDFISTNMDNNLLFDGLSSYAATPGDFQTPPPGVLLRANFKDLLENYVLEGGFRLPTTFNGSEYYLWLDDKKRRLDKRYALYRKTTVNSLDGQPGGAPQLNQVRVNTLLGQYELRYPIDAFFSLRGTGTLRQDKQIALSTNRAALDAPDYSEQRISLRFSAVYDNTVDVDLNIKLGSRARFFVEGVKRFAINTEPKLDVSFNKGFMTIIGLDARHYQALDRRSIIALRLAGSTTLGSERILYYLGGVDNWLFPRFNNNIPTAPGDYSFQTLAAHLRGFRQNIRNGGSFMLLNSELRIPVFKYLSRKPVMGNFWRNFQIVGFFDAGTAWSGRSPFSGDNPINIVSYENPPTVRVTVRYFREPIVAGYGVGARLLLFGMYLRADYGWGIETRAIQKPMLHLALGTDF